ncbi:WXG100 family type VII secretion target [Actinophytocola sediminis]
MTSFDINHNGYLEVNEQLYQAVAQLGQILDDLSTSLARIPEAVRGNAEEIWSMEQREWNKSYEQMRNRLNLNTLASINTHEIFKEGDIQATRIMLQ